MMDENEFERDRSIDPRELDVEASAQSNLFWKWAQRATEARGASDRAKLKLDTVESMLSLEIRKNPKKHGLEKITESSVAATVKTHPDYREACSNYIDAREESSMLDKAVQAMEMKKRMIEALITLHGQQYFAGPNVPRNLGEMWLKQQERLSQRVTKKQTKTLRKRRKKRNKK